MSNTPCSHSNASQQDTTPPSESPASTQVRYEICLGMSGEQMGVMVGLGKETIEYCLATQRRLVTSITLPIMYRDVASLLRSVQVARTHQASDLSSLEPSQAALDTFRATMQADFMPMGRFMLHEDRDSFRAALKGGMQISPSHGHSGYNGIAGVEDKPSSGKEWASVGLIVDLRDKPQELLLQIRELGESLVDSFSESLRAHYSASDAGDANSILLNILAYLTEDLEENQLTELDAARERDKAAGTFGAYSNASGLRARWLKAKWRKVAQREGRGLSSFRIRTYPDLQVPKDADRASSIMIGDTRDFGALSVLPPPGLDLARDHDQMDSCGGEGDLDCGEGPSTGGGSSDLLEF